MSICRKSAQSLSMRSKNSALVHVLDFLSFVIVVKVFFRILIREACLVSYLKKTRILQA